MENETNNEETKLDCSCMPLVSQNLVPSPLSDLSDTNAIPCENISEESLLLSSQKKNNRPSFHAHKPAEVKHQLLLHFVGNITILVNNLIWSAE